MTLSTSTSNQKLCMDKKARGGRQRQFSNEQRKDRNRQAQAAFRDRRSKHTQALEDTISDLRTMVQILQQNAAHAKERADKAEKQCQLLQASCHHLKTTLECLVPQVSPASCELSLHRSPPNIMGFPPQQPWATELSSWPPSMTDDWHLSSIDSLGEFLFLILYEPLEANYPPILMTPQLPLPGGDDPHLFLGKSLKLEQF